MKKDLKNLLEYLKNTSEYNFNILTSVIAVDYADNIEIIYHRKDWGWRNEIMHTFGWWDNKSDTQYKFELEKPSDVLLLIELTAQWLDEERWENEGSSIWGYQESARKHLITDISNLGIIYGWMLNNPDAYLEFYDSY